MKRRDFIKNTTIAGAGGLVVPMALSGSMMHGSQISSRSGRVSIIHAVDAHAAGMHARVVIGGVGALDPAGATMRDKLDYFVSNDDWFRRLMLREPRGFPTAFVNLVIPPTQPGAHAGYLIFGVGGADPTPPVKGPLFGLPGFHMVSGSNTIATATVLLETGVIPMQEPITDFILESPTGLVPISARCASGRVLEVTVEMGPVYATQTDVQIDVPGRGKIRVDIAGGRLLAEAASLGLALEAKHAKELARVGNEITAAARNQLDPAYRAGATILTGPAKDPRNHGRQAFVMGPVLDRSPCGSCLTCRLAAMHATGELKVGEEFRAESVLDTVMTGRVVRETTVEGRSAIITSIAGRAWITGHCDYVVAPDDPFPTGFTVGDIWST